MNDEQTKRYGVMTYLEQDLLEAYAEYEREYDNLISEYEFWAVKENETAHESYQSEGVL